MAYINSYGYLSRSSHKIGRALKKEHNDHIDFLVKYAGNGLSGCFVVGNNTIYCPKKYVGKRIRLKAEVVE